MTVVDQLAFSKNALNQYVKKIEKLIESEVANEESFYADFRDLLKSFFKTNEFEIIIVPKSEETADKPDFIVFMDNIPIIHIEGKKPYDPIDKWLLADTKNRLFDQVYRFRGRENNNIPVIVTDFINIWVIDKEAPNSQDSDHQIKLKLKIIDDSGTSWKAYSGIKPKLESALNYVCKDIVLSISKVSSMIPHLVKYAKKLKEEIIKVFKEPSNPMKIYLENIRNDFLDSIFSSDKEKKSQEFADLFAQTLIYGGFIAWMRFCKDGNSPNDFAFGKATDYLPYGTFIYNIFADMLTKSSPNIRKNIFEKIERIFQSTQFEKITQNTETLMITFYSDFLKRYDPEMAKERGIVYTPYPIVNFIVRGIDYLLKKEFNKSEGVVSSDITFLDPAAGTMAFPCEILRIAKIFFEEKFSKQPGRINTHFKEWVEKSYLANSYAFEILMAPYVLGHFRTTMLLEELGFKIDSSRERIKLFLFNTLMELQTTLKDFRNPTIGQEIVEALNIRNNKNLLVVISNPPYNVSSQNKFKWILDKMEEYKENIQREGTKQIKNLQPLQDDYAKFIRFAQWKIKNNKNGIVGFITNNHYIDGLIFRGMRYSLRKDFDEIWIVNLHGNARKGIPHSVQEKGIKVDKNVFDIKVGVAIVFLIRKIDHNDNDCVIRYIDKWGTKQEKFEFLDQPMDNLNFKIIEKRLDFEFCPDEFKLRNKYQNFEYLLDIFYQHISGVKTHHDSLISDVDRSILDKKLEVFFEKGDLSKFGTDAKKIVDWNPDIVRKKTNIDKAKSKIVFWNYRGFDKRYICYDLPLIVRDRYSLMQYFLSPNKNNIAFVLNRQSIGCKGDSSILAVDTLIDGKCCEGAKGGYSYFFPLLINKSDIQNDCDNPKENIDSNIKLEFKKKLDYGDEISVEQIFYYIYAILYTPIYRSLYHLGLKEDFPRIPFPDKKSTFIEMSTNGNKLIDLHLFKAKILDPNSFPMSKSSDYKIYYIRRNDKDEKGNQISNTYDPSTQKIYFKKRNKTQIQDEEDGAPLEEITWIGEISQKMWDYEIGGRQQLKEWLYARRYSEEIKKNSLQRPLYNDELEYFLKMCDAIKKTIELLPELDEVYKKIDP